MKKGVLKRVLIRLLVTASLLSPLSGCSKRETSFAQTAIKQLMRSYDQPDCWNEAAQFIAHLLGYEYEDIRNLTLSKSKEIINNYSTDKTGAYLCILAENGFLDDLSDKISGESKITKKQFENLLYSVFGIVVSSQQEAEELIGKTLNQTVIVSQDDLLIETMTEGHFVLAPSIKNTIEASEVESVALIGSDSLFLITTEVDLITVQASKENDESYIHLDSDSSVSEILINSEGKVTVEGNGSLGIVRIGNSDTNLTLRATASVLNESDESITIIDPDGNPAVIKAGQQREFVLSSYLINFVSDGTPVDSILAEPGKLIDFSKIKTQKEGKIFTGWYQDEQYQNAFSTLTSVDQQYTLYARFVDEKEAIRIHFETNGGSQLDDLYFAEGETLLVKPVTSLFSVKEGDTFAGWCTDEELTTTFAYDEIIDKEMTLYAYFISEEALVKEQQATSAVLGDVDWQTAIQISSDEELSVEQFEKKISVEKGTGNDIPELVISKEGNVFTVSGSYEKDGNKGFTPGCSFTLKIENDLHFVGYNAAVNELVVSIHKEETEIIDYADNLTHILWSDTSNYVGVVSLDTDSGNNIVPGSIEIKNNKQFAEGTILVIYDGSIDKTEMPVSLWTSGSFDNYVLYAKVEKSEYKNGINYVSFTYANPTEYLDNLDVYKVEEVDLEDKLSEADLAAIKKNIKNQILKNDALKAQIIYAVASSDDTQQYLDRYYGEDVYSLASAQTIIDNVNVEITLEVDGSTLTAGVDIYLELELTYGEKTLLNVTPRLSFIEAITAETTIDGGAIWVDASLSLSSSTTIRLEVEVSTEGEDDDSDDDNDKILEIEGEDDDDEEEVDLADVRDKLEELIRPEGVDDSIDYDETAESIMAMMDDMFDVELEYAELFKVRLLTVLVTFYGIVSMEFDIDLVGQIGFMAMFGLEINASAGQTVGFSFDFKKMKGSSYKNKLPTSVNFNLYVLGKIGIRVGIELTLAINLCGVAKAGISGTIFAYMELSGMYFLTISLLTQEKSSFGALKFEVGIAIEIGLELGIDLLIVSFEKEWTLWEEQFPIYSYTIANKMSYVNMDTLDDKWQAATADASRKSTFGIDDIELIEWDLAKAQKTTRNLILTDKQNESGLHCYLEITKLVIDDEEIKEDDPRYKIFTIGDQSKGESLTRIYLNEEIAAEYLCHHVDLDLNFVMENNGTSALIKKQSHALHLSRDVYLSTTTANIKVILKDWCAQNWGIEEASWNNAEVYKQTETYTHLTGFLAESSNTTTLNLDAVLQSALKQYPELADAELSFQDPSLNGIDNTIIYCTPAFSKVCYLTADNGIVRYETRMGTDEYDMNFYIYVMRYDGYQDTLTVDLELSDMDKVSANFYCGNKIEFVSQTDGLLRAQTSRSNFNNGDNIIYAQSNGQSYDSGLRFNARVTENPITVTASGKEKQLSIRTFSGVNSYKVFLADNPEKELSQEQLKNILPGSKLTVKVQLEEEDLLLSTTDNLALEGVQVEKDTVTFVMPFADMYLDLTTDVIYDVSYLYNYDGLGQFTLAKVKGDDALAFVEDPTINGLTFTGWYLDKQCSKKVENNTLSVEQDLTLYAGWTVNVTIDYMGAKGKPQYYLNNKKTNFFTDGKEDYTSFSFSTLKPLEKLYNLVVPEYSGYAFDGWYTTPSYQGEPVKVDDYVLTKGTTLYAKWVEIFNIDYYLNVQENEETYYFGIEKDTYPVSMIPEDPKRDYYQFTGWYLTKEANPEDKVDLENLTVSQDLVLYAGWTPVQYSIDFNLNGGTVSGNPTSYNCEDETIVISNPTRDGYQFVGWSLNDSTDKNDKVTINKGSHGDIKLTANWQPISYTITYHFRRGVPVDTLPLSYTIEDPDLILANLTKDGYIFEGWKTAEDENSTVDYTIRHGSFGDLVLYDKWTTSDSNEMILLNAEDAIKNNYEVALDDYVEGCGKTSTIYQKIIADIETNADSKNYAEAIEVEISEHLDASKNPLVQENGQTIVRSYDVVVVYTNDNQQKTQTEIPMVVTLTILKRSLNIAKPQASVLNHQENLSNSALTGGSANYIDADQNSHTVAGTFAWKDNTIVPTADHNDQEIYTVVFTPTPDFYHQYCTTEFDVAVNTHYGLIVEIEAEDRAYIKNDVSATVTTYVYLYDDAAGGKGTALTASEYIDTNNASAVFASSKPASGIKVSYCGFTVKADKANLYQLVTTNAETTADITKGTLTITAPTTSLHYNDVLSNSNNDGSSSQLANGKASYGDDTINGIWKWDLSKLSSTTISAVGQQTLPVLFVPEENDCYQQYSGTINTNVAKKEIAVPTVITNPSYNGQVQKPTLSSDNSDCYTTSAGATDVGNYKLTLTLTDPAHYKWADSDQPSVTVDYQILSIKPTAKPADGGVVVTSLVYGQKLSASDVTNESGTSLKRTANGIISGIDVIGLNNAKLAGKWTFKETDTNYIKLSTTTADVGSYQIAAVFTPNDATNYQSIEYTFTVTIIKASPVISGCTVTSSKLKTNPTSAKFYYTFNNQTRSQSMPKYSLYNATLSYSGNATNPITGETVSGSFVWEKLTTGYPIPTTSGEKFNANFVAADSKNYNSVVYGNVPVEFEYLLAENAVYGESMYKINVSYVNAYTGMESKGEASWTPERDGSYVDLAVNLNCPSSSLPRGSLGACWVVDKIEYECQLCRDDAPNGTYKVVITMDYETEIGYGDCKTIECYYNGKKVDAAKYYCFCIAEYDASKSEYERVTASISLSCSQLTADSTLKIYYKAID